MALRMATTDQEFLEEPLSKLLRNAEIVIPRPLLPGWSDWPKPAPFPNGTNNDEIRLLRAVVRTCGIRKNAMLDEAGSIKLSFWETIHTGKEIGRIVNVHAVMLQYNILLIDALAYGSSVVHFAGLEFDAANLHLKEPHHVRKALTDYATRVAVSTIIPDNERVPPPRDLISTTDSAATITTPVPLAASGITAAESLNLVAPQTIPLVDPRSVNRENT